jgi:hypothetical protein
VISLGDPGCHQGHICSHWFACSYVVEVPPDVWFPVLFSIRKRARLRKAPTGSQEVVFVRPPEVDQTILHWGKLGYDLYGRSEIDTAPLRGSRLPEIHIRLAFVKR